MKYSTTAEAVRFGAEQNARRVTKLTNEERKMIRAGGEIRIAGCPCYRGETDRIVIERGGRFYTRMPQA